MAKAVVGVSDHGGWAVLVSVAGGAVVDRRRVTLVDEGLCAIPHHTDAQLVPLDEGVALVKRVRASAERCCRAALEALARDVEVGTIALRACPELPPTIEERITNVRARNNADWVMYREVLAEAARALGWKVAWFVAKEALAAHAEAVRVAGNADHRLAMAGALATAPASLRPPRAEAARGTSRVRRGSRSRGRPS